MKLTAKKISVALAFALVFILAFSLILTAGGGITFAASPSTVDTVKLGHVSDIHYFPLEYCYRDRYNENYADSDFNFASTGDTKLILESGVVLNKMVDDFIKDASRGQAPHTVLATGDLCKNGERVALIDVANIFRYMQNEIRKISGYSDFQVLVMPGNHDLYNGSGQLYENTDGGGYPADVLTAAEFALIFAGLGYPDASMSGKLADDTDCVNLTDYFPADYYTNGADGFTGLIGNVTGVVGAEGYVQSANASEFYEFEYYNEELQKEVVPDETGKGCNYNEIGHENNVLSYMVTFKNHSGYTIFALDTSDREEAESPVYIRVSPKEFKEKYTNDKNFKAEEFYFAVNDEDTDKVSYNREKDYARVYDAINSNVPVYMNAKINHITGGRINEPCLNWVKDNAAAAASSDGLAEETIIAAFHHNIVPHFTMEDEILKDFTVYNWEYNAKELLKYGVRYAFTGHMHSNDTAVYTDAKGRTLTDTETGSAVSYDSPKRYIDVVRGNSDNKLCEQYKSSLRVQKDSLFGTADRPGATESWDENAYAAAGGDPEKQIAANPEFYISTIHHNSDTFKKSYNTFVNGEIYGQLVSRILDHFLSDKMIESLIAPVHNLLGEGGIISGTVGDLLSAYEPILDKMVTYVLDVALGGTEKGTLFGKDKGYPYENQEYDKLTEYLRAVVDSIVGTGVDSGDGMLFGSEELGKVNAGEMLAYSFVSHVMGREILEDYDAASGSAMYVENTPDDPIYRARLKAGLDDFFAQCENGTFASDFLNSLLKPLLTGENTLIDALLNYKFDFTNNAGFTEDEKAQLNNLSGVLNEVLVMFLPDLGNVNIDMSNIVIGDLLETLMPALSGVIGGALGFTITGTDVKEILLGFIDSYLTDSFNVGLGGIAKDIVASLASDTSKDMANIQNPADILTVKPYASYGNDVAGADSPYIYINGVPANGNPSGSEFDKNYNKPTDENGRLPSRVTANFETNGTNVGSGASKGATKFKISFYTAEDVFATFKWKDTADGDWQSVATTQYTNRDKVNDLYRPDKFLSATSTTEHGGVKVTLKTEAIPQYIPFIDLGLLSITHSEISYEGNNGDVLYGALDRDYAPSNSVLYYNRHTVTIEGLNPDTEYCYDLVGTYGDDNDADADRLLYSLKDINNGGTAYTFKTAPDKNANTFEFLAMADIQGMIQSMYDESYTAMSELMNDDALNKYSFILNAGDMTDNGKNYTQWGYALDTYQKAFMNTSTFLTSGNHEKDTDALGRFYDYAKSHNYVLNPGGNGYYYSFDYGTAHFTVLDTNDLTNNNLSSDQMHWLENDLRLNRDAEWKFVLMHKSLFSSGAHATDAEVIKMRNELVPLFNKNGVNIVFGGHDHTYTVTNLIGRDGTDQGAVKTSDGTLVKNSGTLYVTLGTAGTKYYDYKETETVTPYVDEANSINGTLDSQTFGRIAVKNGVLTYTGYKFNADAADGESKFEVISNLKIASDNALMVEEIKKDNAGVKSSYVIGFAEKNIDKLEINKTRIPRDFEIVYLSDGKEYQKVSEIAVNGKQITIDIAVKDNTGLVNVIKTVTVERENYILIIAGSAGGGAALILIIVIAVVTAQVTKRKKAKKNNKKRRNGKGGGSADGGRDNGVTGSAITLDAGSLDGNTFG